MKTSKIIVTFESRDEGQPAIVAEAPFLDVIPSQELNAVTKKSEVAFQKDGEKVEIYSLLTDWDTLRIEVFQGQKIIAEYTGKAVNCSSSLGLSVEDLGYIRVYYMSDEMNQ